MKDKRKIYLIGGIALAVSAIGIVVFLLTREKPSQQQPATGNPASSGTQSGTQSGKKSNEEIAREVVAGLWGNGNERKQRLAAAGYDYEAVQAIVNQLMA